MSKNYFDKSGNYVNVENLTLAEIYKQGALDTVKLKKMIDSGFLKRTNEHPRGKWIERPNDQNHFRCSECGKPCDMVLTVSGYIVEQLSDFCPDCGADMRPKEGEAE